jgi:acetyl-CoA C-acetyltransferase
MVERLRREPGARGLVTGNGWYLTKHSALVLASARRERGPIAPSDGAPAPDVPETTASTGPTEGPARLETYTVIYDREGAPQRGIVLGSTLAGRRFVANTPDERGFLEAFVAVENVGRRGRVRVVDGQNRFEPS